MTKHALARAAVLAAGVLFLVGCQSDKTAPLPPDNAPVTTGKPLPTYAAAAEKYNQHVAPLERFSARAIIRLTYKDKDGVEHTEQPEGTLQIIRPRRLALDLGKAGQKLFWFGSDDERYWWLDLSDNNDRVAAVGHHDQFATSGAGKRLGVALSPLDLIAAMGVTPIDPAARGVTQWSRDGRRLGIVSPFTGRGGGGGLQRLWVDPATMIPFSIELFDANRKLVLTATHEGEERIESTRAGERPRLPARVTCIHHESGSEIRITLSDAKEGPISDKAFMLDELMRRLGVVRMVDLDQP